MMQKPSHKREEEGGYTARTRNYVANDDQKKQGCQERRPPPVGDATSERSPDTHKVRPQHTQAARNNMTNKQGYGTDVLQWAQYASASQKC
jgi:hypothetical protein